MRANLYPYKGKEYTLNQLAAMFPEIKKSVLDHRLRRGMTVEEAIGPQTWQEIIPKKYQNKELVICFDSHPPVFQAFLPDLNEQYLAIPHREGARGKCFYTINVRGRNLIVYPGEFRILGVAKRCSSQENTTSCTVTVNRALFPCGVGISA